MKANGEQPISNIIVICNMVNDYELFKQQNQHPNLSLIHCTSIKKSKKYLTEKSVDGFILYKKETSAEDLIDFVDFLNKQDNFPVPIIIIDKSALSNIDKYNQSVLHFPLDTEIHFILGVLFGMLHGHIATLKSLKAANKIISVSKKLKYGEFEIKSIDEAKALSIFLSNHFPNINNAAIGIFELLLNAIEHGNLRIGHELKCKLVNENTWVEEIEQRLSKQEKDASVKVKFKQNNEVACIVITDSGEGFDWRKYYYLDPAHSSKIVGRGILMAKNICFDVLTYNKSGNEVSAYVKKDAKFDWR